MAAPAASSSTPSVTPSSGWFYVGGGNSAPRAAMLALDVAASAASDAKPVSLLAHPKLLQPTAEQLGALTSIASSGSKGRAKSKKGKFVVKVYNPQASRPQPTLNTPLSEYRATLSFATTAFTTSTSVPTYWASAFSINNFDGVSSYTALFDEYKVEQFEAWLEPSIIMSPSVGSTIFYSAVDLDDANTPASAQDVDGRQGCAISETGTGHYHKWKPFVSNALYSGAFTSYGSEPAPWIDCASTSVQHYGLKAAVPAADGIARLYTLFMRCVVAWRGPAI